METTRRVRDFDEELTTEIPVESLAQLVNKGRASLHVVPEIEAPRATPPSAADRIRDLLACTRCYGEGTVQVCPRCDGDEDCEDHLPSGCTVECWICDGCGVRPLTVELAREARGLVDGDEAKTALLETLATAVAAHLAPASQVPAIFAAALGAE